MFFYRLYKFISLILLLCILGSCIQKNTNIIKLENQNNDFYSFKDKDSLLLVLLEKGFQHHEFNHENEKYYIFEWYLSDNKQTEQNIQNLQYRLEIRVFNQNSIYYNDIKNPDYESFFYKICNCIINQKGWILLQDINARIFHYTIKNISGISVHLNKKNFLIQIAIFSKDYELAQKKLNFILKNIKLL